MFPLKGIWYNTHGFQDIPMHTNYMWLSSGPGYSLRQVFHNISFNRRLQGKCTLECHWNATGWPSVHWDTTGWHSEYLQGTPEHHWKNLVAPHWNATGKKIDYCSLHWNTTGESITAPIHRHISLSRVASMPVWNDKGMEYQAASGQVSVKSVFTWSLPLSNAPVLFVKRVSISSSLCACLGYEHHYSFCVFGVAVQMKSA